MACMVNETLSKLENHPEDRCDQLRLFFQQARPAIFAQLAMGVFLLYLAWDNLDTDSFHHAGAWFAFLLAVSMGRLALIRKDRRLVEDRRAETPQTVEVRHTRLGGASGLAWGIVPWFAWQGDNAVLDYLAGAMVFGMAGSATATLAALPGAFSWFVWPAVFPYVVKAILIGGNIYMTAAAVMLFGIVALTHFNRTVHRMIAESIRLRRENAELVYQLQAEKSAIEEALRIKSLFLAGVSHDLKHPLNALGLYLAYLKAQPEGINHALPGMEQALSGMGGQLSRLLELSRLESGALQVNPQRHDVAALLAAACRTAQPAADGKGLRLRCRTGLPCKIETDARMLQSVLDNLLSNAVRYTERGGVLAGLRRGKEGWRIEIWDTGIGIPGERLPLLFDAYRRFDDTSHATEKGYGLGLALAKKQCDLLGYRLSVASRVGSGTVFRIRFP
jgi:signal transduction histidine kinase